MPPFLDRVQLDHALQYQALPHLEALAANDSLRNRSLRRFERDDPPPYVESTESEELDDAPLPPLDGKLPQDLLAVMEPPLSTDELTPYYLENLLEPVHIYHLEAEREQNRVESHVRSTIYRGREGAQREGVIVRHSVKRRWEKLGVWNPEWGFPGRKSQPRDDIYEWKWPWQQHETDSSEPGGSYTQQLLARALQLRQNLRRGESSPMIPRSHLKQDASASEAELFIISRPWFIFRVEVTEETARYDRLSFEQRWRYPYSAWTQVIEWWKERGDWKEEFDTIDDVTSWKWRHESPSPEPEDLTLINNIKLAPLDTADMDFTPSEIDDLETIELPRSEQHPDYWTVKDQIFGLRSFPGEIADLQAEAAEEAKKFPHRFELPPDPNAQPLFPPTPPPRDEHEDDSLELEEKVLTPQNPPPVRRSARIASMKRPAEDLLTHTAPNKKPKGRAASKAAEPAAQHARRETRRRNIARMPASTLSEEPSQTQSRRAQSKKNNIEPRNPSKSLGPRPSRARTSKRRKESGSESASSTPATT
jgi:hypothetical protein